MRPADATDRLRLFADQADVDVGLDLPDDTGRELRRVRAAIDDLLIVYGDVKPTVGLQEARQQAMEGQPLSLCLRQRRLGKDDVDRRRGGGLTHGGTPEGERNYLALYPAVPAVTAE
jgi:hypothetical protein